MTYQKKVETNIVELKSRAFPGVTLNGNLGGTSFTLELLTRDCVDNTAVMSRLSRWRKKQEQWFPAVFPVTVSRTRDWYIRRLIDVSDRVLFLIRVGTTYVGHVGLYRFDYQHKTCDIDNILRGRKGNPGIMEAAITVLMEWGSEQFDIQSYTLSTFLDNQKAGALYRRLGFQETDRKPLVFLKNDEGGSWEEVIAKPNETYERYMVYMKK